MWHPSQCVCGEYVFWAQDEAGDLVPLQGPHGAFPAIVVWWPERGDARCAVVDAGEGSYVAHRDVCPGEVASL